jgi:hypothetical protein
MSSGGKMQQGEDEKGLGEKWENKGEIKSNM